MAARKRRAVLAGTIAGVRMVTKAYEPSLMPRSGVDQGIIAGGSFLSGFIAGTAASIVADLLPRRAANPMLRIAGGAVTGYRTARSASLGRGAAHDTNPHAAGWLDLGAEIVSAVALSRVILEADSALPRAGAVAAIGLSTVANTGAAMAERTDPFSTKDVALSAGVGVGVIGGAAVLTYGIRLAGYLPARRVTKRTARAGVSTLGSLVTGGVIAWGTKQAFRQATGRLATGNRGTEVAFAEAPSSPNVSGGPGSTIPYGTLGLQGRRFVSDVTSAANIEEVMGESAMADPIRVYVGVDTADSAEARIDAAMAELERTGAFDRSIIIAVSPSGTGYVNPIAVQAAELMSRGNCATVAVQYGLLPSLLSANKVSDATALHGALLRRIRNVMEASGSPARLVAYGESLGALTSQAGVDAVSDHDELIVERALWVGTPKGSTLFDRLTRAETPVFDQPADLLHHLEDHAAPRYVFLNHHNDPVTTFAPTDFYRMPAWLGAPDRGRGTNPNQRWVPAVSFLQGAIDTKNAATVIPGEFLSTGHDYRADLATFVAAAYGFTVSDVQMGRIEKRLRESELRRAGQIALGRVPAHEAPR